MLVFAEAWFNFSYYGTRVLLVLYMARVVLLPGHAARVLGLGLLRAGFERSYGALSPVALAAAIAGLFASLTYLVPLAGAFLADRWLGRSRAILIGALLIVAGNALLVAEAGFVVALPCLLVGIGLFGGNLAAQLGALYGADDPRRGDGFQIYYLAVDAGAILGPLACGALRGTLGFSYGFAAAGLAMLVAIIGYLAGRRSLPADGAPRRSGMAAPRPPIGRAGWQAVAVLLLLIPVIGIAAVANNQIYGIYEVWGDANYDLVFFGRHMPVEWLISADALISFGCGILILALWRWLERRGALPSEVTRCAIGALLSAAAAGLLACAAWAAHGGRIGLGWAIAFHALNNLGICMLFPLTLALFSRAAPPGLAGTMINASKLNFFISFQIVGWLGGLVDRIGGGVFWAIHAAIVACGGVALFIAGHLFRRQLAPKRTEGASA